MTVAPTLDAPPVPDLRQRSLRWLQRVEEPAYRLFLLHHAGGSPALFRPWQRDFPADWDVCAIGLPGRGRLHDRPPVDNCPELVRFLLSVTDGLLDRPYGLFGHSMGGLLGYELTRALQAGGGPLPSWLGISACAPPRIHHRERASREPAMSDAQLRDWLARFGDAPPELLGDERLWRTFSPMLRADLDLVQSWTPDLALAPLPVPVTVFGGQQDPMIEPADLARWAEHTRHFSGTQLYPGDHFYLSVHRRRIARQIALCILYVGNGILPGRSSRTERSPEAGRAPGAG